MQKALATYVGFFPTFVFLWNLAWKLMIMFDKNSIEGVWISYGFFFDRLDQTNKTDQWRNLSISCFLTLYTWRRILPGKKWKGMSTAIFWPTESDHWQNSKLLYFWYNLDEGANGGQKNYIERVWIRFGWHMVGGMNQHKLSFNWIR